MPQPQHGFSPKLFLHAAAPAGPAGPAAAGRRDVVAYPTFVQACTLTARRRSRVRAEESGYEVAEKRSEDDVHAFTSVSM
jgi:hypothetical protein